MKKIMIAALAAFSLIFAAAPALAYNPLGPICKSAPTNPACVQNKSQTASGTNPALRTIQTATNLIAIIAGIGAVIVIIVSGLMFVTAGGATPGQRAGDPNAVKKARAALFGAVIGLAVIALAWTIVTFATTHLVKT